MKFEDAIEVVREKYQGEPVSYDEWSDAIDVIKHQWDQEFVDRMNLLSPKEYRPDKGEEVLHMLLTVVPQMAYMTIDREQIIKENS